MATSINDIRTWLEEAKGLGCSYMIVAVDKFDWEDFPIYCITAEKAKSEYRRILDDRDYNVMEVYCLLEDIEAQLNEKRAFHLPN